MESKYTFNEYTVTAKETEDAVEFYLKKKGLRRKVFMFGLTKEDTERYSKSGELEAILYSNIPSYAGEIEGN